MLEVTTRDEPRQWDEGGNSKSKESKNPLWYHWLMLKKIVISHAFIRL